MKKRIIFFLNLFLAGLIVATINSCKEDEFLIIKEVVITWENPAELVEGLPLTEAQLNATANVPGSIVFTPALGTVLPKGDNQELKAEFTPRDTEKYKSLSKTVTINIVDKYIPVITWENPAVLPLGKPLTEEQLNATADVEGTFVYTPPLGTVLPLGDNQELRVDFTPSVPTHQATSKTVFINVRDVVPLRFADGAMYTGLQSIAFNVDGEVGSLGDNPQTGFTVHVINKAKLTDKEVGITAVSIDPANAKRIELTLDGKIYGDDVITVAFNEDGNSIRSAQQQPLKSFEAQMVDVPVIGDDILAGKAWAGFEAAGGANAAGAAGYWVGKALPWQRTTDMAASGNASMKYTGGFDINPLWGMNFGDNVDIEAGVYEVSHKIYIEPGSDLKMLRTAIARKSKGWADDTQTFFDVENITRGEWVTIKSRMSFPVAYNNSDKTRYSYYVEQSLNQGVTGDQTFYLDDMGLKKVDAPARP